MEKHCDIFGYQNNLFDKLHYAHTLVNMTKTSCLEREFSRQYYGVSQENIKKLSDERNEYVAMLDLISNQLSDIKEINLCMEAELSLYNSKIICNLPSPLQKNADYSCG